MQRGPGMLLTSQENHLHQAYRNKNTNSIVNIFESLNRTKTCINPYYAFILHLPDIALFLSSTNYKETTHAIIFLHIKQTLNNLLYNTRITYVLFSMSLPPFSFFFIHLSIIKLQYWYTSFFVDFF